MMIQIEWWSRSSDDVQWWSRSSDDPDPVMISNVDPDPVMMSSDDPDLVMMIQIEWWSRSSDDDPDQVMIHIQWWNMTWRWRWWELNDDPDDTEKKTYVDKLCWENTFLVKMECWCNCNFRMYSSIYLMYYTPMFILGCVCNVFESCHAPMFLSGVSIM